MATRKINTGTGAIGTKITVPVGFAPKVIFAFMTGRVGTGNSVVQGDTHKSVGFAVSPISRAVGAGFDADSVGTTVAKSALRSDCLLTAIDGVGTAGRLDLDAIGATDFDLIIDEVFGANYAVLLWILGGTTITGASIVNHQTPLALGNNSVVGFGLAPKVYFHLGIGEDAAIPQFRNGSKLAFCAAVSATQQGVSYSASEDGKATSKTRHYANDIESYVGPRGNTAIEEIADHVSMDADGFTEDFTKVNATKAREVFTLAIAGGDWAIKPILTVADTVTPIVVAGLASSPSGGIIVSGCDVENVSDTQLAPNRISYGAWTIPGVSQGAHGTFSRDAVGTTAVSPAVRNDSCYVRVLTTNLTQGRMNVTSRDALGASFIMSEADAAAHFTWAVFGGPFATAFPPPVPPVTGGALTMVEGVTTPLTKLVG